MACFVKIPPFTILFGFILLTQIRLSIKIGQVNGSNFGNHNHLINNTGVNPNDKQINQAIDNRINLRNILSKQKRSISSIFQTFIIKSSPQDKMSPVDVFYPNCSQKVLYSVSNPENKSQCICPKKTEKYSTRNGEKCLKPQLKNYPWHVTIVSGFLAFLVPSVVAYLCRHQEQVQHYKLKLSRRKKKNVQDKQDHHGELHQTRENHLKDSKHDNYSKSQISPTLRKSQTMSHSRRWQYASSVDIPNNFPSSIHRYASATDY